MAKIQQEAIVVNLSKLVKTGTNEFESLLTPELISAVEQVAQELAGDGVIVEIDAGGVDQE